MSVGLNMRLKLNERESYGGDGECVEVFAVGLDSRVVIMLTYGDGCVLCAELFCLEDFCWIWILSYDLILLQVNTTLWGKRR